MAGRVQGGERRVRALRAPAVADLEVRPEVRIVAGLQAHGPAVLGRHGVGTPAQLRPEVIGHAAGERGVVHVVMGDDDMGGALAVQGAEKGAEVPIVVRRRAVAGRRVERILSRNGREQMLTDARALLARKGRLTSALLDVAPDTASARQYIERFGSLGKLYELIGYEPSTRQRLTLERGVGRRRHPAG